MKHAPIPKSSDEEVPAPVDVRSYASGKPPSDMPDGELSKWLQSLPPCPGLPATPEEIAAADAQADADIAAGRGIPHDLVREWLLTWGTPSYKPMPREWLE